MKTDLVRIENDIKTLATFNATPEKGLTRFSFTEQDKQARKYIKKEMKKAGLEVYEDSAGTIVGRLEGKSKNAPIVMLGSHYDSVKNGGKFDGTAGVVAALEVARAIKENKIKFNNTIEFIAMIEEEGGRFGSGLFASRAMVGRVSQKELYNSKDNKGISMAQAMKEFGFDPDKIHVANRKPEDIKAFLELHIEQGPILEKNNIDIGIVEYIVGIKQLEITVEGRSDHAGTTPMNMRLDALDAASQVISKLSKFTKKVGKETVATIGTLNVFPGAANIVPERVNFTIDIRSKCNDCITKIVNFLNKELENIKLDKGVDYTIIEKLNAKPVKLDENIAKIFDDKCEKLGLSSMNILSGAGHDAMVMTEITRVGLIFVPSKDGKSHCPEEWTDYNKLQNGTELMFHALLNIGEVYKYES